MKSVVSTEEPSIEDFFRQKNSNGSSNPSKNHKNGGSDDTSANFFSSPEERPWTKTPTYEGQLSVDVYQDADNIIVQSTIAGVRPEDLDIALNNDMLTIKGVRSQQKNIKEEDYFYRECYWGGFSRSIILPVDVIADRVEAKLVNGVLTVKLPKAQRTNSRSIPVKS